MTSNFKSEPDTNRGRPGKPMRVSGRKRRTPRVLAQNVRPGLHLPKPPEGVWRNPVFRIAILGFALLAVLALAADLISRFRSGPLAGPLHVPATPEALVLGIRDRVYTDPAGRFRLTVPAVWRVQTPPGGAAYDVIFRGPMDLECAVRVTPVSHQRFDRLLADIYAIEEQWGVNMNIQAQTVDDRPIVERRVRLIEQQVLALDFLHGAMAHHIQFGAPRDDFDRFEPLFRDIFESYTPLDPADAPREQ